MITDTYPKAIIDKATVARLATVDSECKPHLIPVVFVFDNDHYFIPIDEKTKRSQPGRCLIIFLMLTPAKDSCAVTEMYNSSSEILIFWDMNLAKMNIS